MSLIALHLYVQRSSSLRAQAEGLKLESDDVDHDVRIDDIKLCTPGLSKQEQLILRWSNVNVSGYWVFPPFSLACTCICAEFDQVPLHQWVEKL